MTTPGIVIAAIVALAALFIIAPLILHTVSRYRAARMLACPETGERTRVDIDATYAGLTAPLGKPRLRVRWCSRWQGRTVCDEGCLQSAEARRP